MVDPVERGIGRRVLRHSGGTGRPGRGVGDRSEVRSRLEGLEAASARALEQIKEKRYDERLRGEGREDILAYGIAFCKKRCKVACQRL